MLLAPSPRRTGATAVETAIVLSVLFLLVCGLIIGGIGVFRHQQVTCLACEGARWASTHGGEYEKEPNTSAVSLQQIIDQAVTPKTVGMNPADVSVKVEWIDRSTDTAWDWDSAPRDMRSITPMGEYVSNTVRVTVTYRWPAGMFWGTTTMQSVCELPMSN
ncbi:pilus assembly protein [Gemmata sp. G18]|uniref:Pilus assembly protein n=1 Tax=Gemmata palustris TaxID=2822762 RepID=A0ABS5BXI2_9BACT|nr:TadE/TadG family type IV pilus assembly protein [Gemmata palustris]MBP3958456.1 pilus assembly protein [Gemmata palustris]